MGLGNLKVGREFNLLDLDGRNKKVRFLSKDNGIYRFLNIEENEEFDVPFPYVLEMDLSFID